MSICWLNGSFGSEATASISIFDRGLLFGDGVYEVATVVQGRLLDADRHLVRLDRSLAAIGCLNPLPLTRWLAVLQQLVEANALREGLVYLQVTRGAAERDFAFPAAATPTHFAFARAKRLLNDPAAGGVSVRVVPDQRWARCDIKSTAMLAQVLAKQAAREAGAFEAMMHDGGVVTEGSSSNLWIVQQGTLVTRPVSHDILAGITRDVVLELAQERGLPVSLRPFTVDDARAAEECLMTSATSFVLPVVSIDGQPVGSGTPGPVARLLREAYIERAVRLTRG
jgi:D-alanine transaminase